MKLLQQFKSFCYPNAASTAPTIRSCLAYLLALALLAVLFGVISKPFITSVPSLLTGFSLGFLFIASLIVTKYIGSGRVKWLDSTNMAVFFAFSLLRVVFFGYALFALMQAEYFKTTSPQESPTRFTLVLFGFLGYSSWIFLEYLLRIFLLKSRSAS